MPHQRTSGRSAMTLIEVLVVIGIVALLMGLLLPALQGVREMAAQTTCRNNLKQIGLALNAYHNTAGNLPPGFWCETLNLPEVEFASPGWGWAAYLLPHLEESALMSQLHWDLSVEDTANDDPRSQMVKTYICPSDIDTGVYRILSEYNSKVCYAATNSYTACYGYGGAVGESAGNGNGIFYRNSHTRYNDIRDGTSTTLAIGERAGWFCQVPWIGVITNGTVRTSPNSPTYLAAIEEAPVMVLGRTSDGPLNNPYSSPYDFYSPHPTTGNFLFADGSVRALTFSLSPAVWQAIGTRAGGETVSESDLDGN